MNQTIETLLKRRSIRKYISVQISDADFKSILDTGLYAPNGGNMQYTRLIAVQNPEVLARINAVVRDELRKCKIIEGMYKSKVNAITKAQNDEYNFMFHAPTLIIALSLIGHGNAMADCALALGNMQNAAASLGLGSCYINQMHWLTDNSNLREYIYKLGMFVDENIYGCMVLGYPDQPIQNPTAHIEGRVVIIK